MTSGADNEGNACPKDYKFGIELEFFMCPKDPEISTDSLRVVQGYFANMWRENMDNKDYPGLQTERIRNNQVWRLPHEHSMGEFKKGERKYWPLEIVSPILKYGEYEDWQAKIKEVIGFYEKYAILIPMNSCGLHIHVSPNGSEWRLDQLKHIALAIIKFGDVFDGLFGEQDLDFDGHTKSNKNANLAVKGQSLAQITDMINGCKSIEALVDIVNFKNEIHCDYRDYSWNFTNMSCDDKHHAKQPLKTLEYRSPRATTDLKNIYKWVVFAVTFLNASLVSEDNLDVELTKDDLDKFLNENRPSGVPAKLCWE